MERLKEIRLKIKELEKELQNAILEESKTILYSEDIKTDDKIGFFNLTKARTVLNASYNGDILLLQHEVLGNYEVFMNPQKNRILVSPLNSDKSNKFDITEESIMSFIVWCSGDWYILKH